MSTPSCSRRKLARHLLGTRFTTMANASSTQNVANHLPAANGLAIVRVTIGAMLVWVFFENLGKGLYTPEGYAGLINYYIKTVTRRPRGRQLWVWWRVMPRSRLLCRR